MNSVLDSNEDARFHLSGPYLAGLTAFLLGVNLLIVFFAQRRFPLDTPLLAAAFCLNVYLGLFLLLGNRHVQTYLVSRVSQDRHPVWQFVGILLAAYLVYALGTQSLRGFPALKLLAYVVIPTALMLTPHNLSGRLRWQDALVILALWLPLDFRWTRDAWGWPRHSLAYSMNSLLATCLAAFLFMAVRRLDGVGYQYHFQRSDWWIGLRNFLCFAPIAIPIGLYTEFIRISSTEVLRWQFLAEFVLSAAGIFVFIAMPEELLFRGIIQNFLQKSWLKPLPALIVTSVIFGVAHLNNGPRPDWRYFLLATIAGLFYGNAYTRTRALLAPAIVHTLVDTVWRSFFR